MNLRLGLLLVVVGCDSNVNKPFEVNDSGGPGNDGFVFNTPDLTPTDDGGVLMLDLAGAADGPTITITSPMMNEEVAYDTLTVTATIVGKNGAIVDGNTVQILIPTKAGGFLSAPMQLTAMQDVYKGSIDISSIRSGPSSFTVVASDVNGKQGAASQNYVHDHGPTITFIQPTAPTATGSLYVEVLIDDPLHPLADASTVKATIHSGDNIMLAQIAGAVPLRVQSTIKFTDYSPPLDGTQILTVTAANSKGTVGKGIKQFTVDNAGPTITFVNPMPGDFIGGVLQIQATIDDLSGVADNSVVAVFGGDLTKSVQLTRTMPNMPLFEGLFDVRQLGTNYVLPTLSVRAADTLGNQSELAEEIIVDNTPPLLSLDPPPIFIGKILAGNILQCSQPFDPVGDDAANDGQKVQQVITLRARVEDRGNFASGLSVVRYSGIAPHSVFLYGVPVANGPLAVDTDGDHNCDDVNPLLVPTTNITASNQAIAVELTSIPPGGNLDLRPTPSPSPVPAACQQLGDPAGVAPLALCSFSSPMTFVISADDGVTPVIYTVPPVVNNPFDCVGFQFDSLNRMPEGPACFAVVARDNAGNHLVSKPLRVCIDRGGGQCNPGTWPPTTLPNCTGTYDKVANMTNNTACNTQTFGSPGLRIPAK
jgi:hypothetical protein